MGGYCFKMKMLKGPNVYVLVQKAPNVIGGMAIAFEKMLNEGVDRDLVKIVQTVQRPNTNKPCILIK
jgi:hypothetical protein